MSKQEQTRLEFEVLLWIKAMGIVVFATFLSMWASPAEPSELLVRLFVWGGVITGYFLLMAGRQRGLLRRFHKQEQEYRTRIEHYRRHETQHERTMRLEQEKWCDENGMRLYGRPPAHPRKLNGGINND